MKLLDNEDRRVLGQGIILVVTFAIAMLVLAATAGMAVAVLRFVGGI